MKKIIAGIGAVLFSVSAVTGAFAFSDPGYQATEQEEVWDGSLDPEDPEMEKDPSDWEEDRDDPGYMEEIPDTDFEEEAPGDVFTVNVKADYGRILFDSDVSGMSEEEKILLTDEELLVMQSWEHSYAVGESVRFYVRPFEGYECDKVTVSDETGPLSLTLDEKQRYEFYMPERAVTLEAEFVKTMQEEDEAEMSFTDGQDAVPAVNAAAREIAVKAVDADYKMNPEYAFTYAFRKNTTKLAFVQGALAELPEKLDRQFGWSTDSSYGANYKNTFLACSIQNTLQKGNISARYTNVGEYRGKIVDLQITATEWGTVSNSHIGVDRTEITPCILFYKDRIAFSTISVGIVRFRFEFFDNETGTQIYPKGHITMMDLDGGQGFRIYDAWGVDGMYIRKGFDHLSATTGASDSGNVYTEVRAPEGVSTRNDDVKGWCHVDFDSSFTVNWLAGAAALKGTSPYMAFFMSGAQSVGTYEPNAVPEKKVGNTGKDYEEMTRHESESDASGEAPYDIPENREFDYMISQTVLPGDYRKFVVTDTLDPCLQYQNASVVTALGNDVTSRFEISEEQNTVKFAAKSDFLNTDESCNDVTYYFRIHVKVREKRAVAEHGHFGDGIYYHIPNQAERFLESSQKEDVRETNISWIRGTIESGCSIRKTDAEDQEKILSDAVFEIYEWDTGKQDYLPTGQQMPYIGESKLYTTVQKLQYRSSNAGKFRLVETKPPEGYKGGWQADIDILEETFQDPILQAENTLLRAPYGEITVTKKIRKEDIIWAHGNPVFRFVISGTDQKGLEHTYENYVEFQEKNYQVQGEYAVLNCTFQKIPFGTYTICEKETLRYQLQELTADTSNVKIAGREGKAVLDRVNKTAAVTFVNTKTRYDGYSHTDVIRNQIAVRG
nr:isopeptide-forming domain-containing fimbrial protein [uncultured Blautia sp.]